MLPGNELSSKAHIAGFAFPVKTPRDFLEDWEQGGIALNDASEGLEVQLWHLQAKYNETTGNVDCILEAPSVVPTVLFSGADISEVALAFDQNMNPFVAYIQAGTPKIYWYDPIIPGMTHTTLPAGCYDLRCTLDDHRDFAVGDSDIVLGYINGGNLCVRYQSDRYLIEHVLRSGIGGNARLVSMAMNHQWRLQFRLRNYVLTDDPQALISAEPFLGDIVYDLCRQAGIAPENIDVSELYDPVKDRVPGLLVDSDDGLDKPIQWLMDMFQFDKVEHGRKLRFIKRGRPVVARIPFNKLIDDHPKTLKRTERDRAKLPRTVNINHIDPDGGFAKNKQSASRRTNMSAGTGTKNIDSRVVVKADQAAEAALRKLKILHNEYEDFEFSTRLEYTYLTPGDVVEVEDFDGTWYRMHLTERNEDDGNIKWEAETDGGYLVYDNIPVSGKPLDPPVSTTPGNVGDTTLEILNLPVQRDQDDELGLYVAARGASSGWTGYTLSFSVDGGVTYQDAYTSERFANIGETVTTLSDSGTSVEVLVPYPLESVSVAQINAGYNRAVIGDEEVQYRTATLIGMVDGQYHYALSNLERGVLRTVNEAWGAGIRFVAIDESVLFLQIQRAYYGADIYYKAVSIGQPADEVTATAYLFDFALSQTEWAVSNVVVAANSGGPGLRVTWDPAPRLGTFGPTPYQSKYFTGYRLKFSDGHIADVAPTATSYVHSSAVLTGATITVEVWSVNAITGESRWTGGSIAGGGSGGGGTGEGGGTGGVTGVVVSGSLPGGYVGVVYLFYPFFNDDNWELSGGGDLTAITGDPPPGISAFGSDSNSIGFTGVPLASGTFSYAMDIKSVTGAYSDTQSIIIAPKPTYSMLDMLRKPGRLVATTPPWTTFDSDGGGISMGAVSTGKVRAEFTLSNVTGNITFGVHADSLGSLAYSGRPGCGYYTSYAAGTFAVELDADTGAWHVRTIGGTSVASGTLPLTYADDGKYRIGFYCNGTARVKANFGNETWAITPTAGFGGLPMPTVQVPAQWDSRDNVDSWMASIGSKYTNLVSSGSLLNPGADWEVIRAQIGKSSGQWAFAATSPTTVFGNDQRVGICTSAFDAAAGHLGAAGTANSIGIRGQSQTEQVPGDSELSMDYLLLSWCFGGVSNSARISFTRGRGAPTKFTFAVNFSTGTVSIYCEGEGVPRQLVYTLTGLPAGTYFPAVTGRSNLGSVLYPEVDVPGFNNWVTTI